MGCRAKGRIIDALFTGLTLSAPDVAAYVQLRDGLRAGRLAFVSDLRWDAGERPRSAADFSGSSR